MRARARTPAVKPKIPEMTVRRLSVYTRCLQQLEEDGVKTVSSQELAERFNFNSAQVRKDLAYFGEFGVRGIGYYVSGLKAELQKILGLDREWQVALVGLGNLGRPCSTTRGSRGRASGSPSSSTTIRRRSARRRTTSRSCRSATWPARSRPGTCRSPSWPFPPSRRRR